VRDNLKELVKNNPKSKVESTQELSQVRDLYKEIGKLKSSVESLQSEVFKPTEIAIPEQLVTPMTNLLDNSDFSYSWREGSVCIANIAETTLAKWYTRSQTNEQTYVNHSNFFISDNAITTPGRLEEWSENDVEILEGAGPTEGTTIYYKDYPAGTPVRIIGEGKNKCIYGNGSVETSDGVVANYLNNYGFPEIDEDKIYYIHSFYGRDTLETVGAQRGYKITTIPGGSPLKVRKSDGTEEDYIVGISNNFLSLRPTSWTLLSGTEDTDKIWVTDYNNDAFVRPSSSMYPYNNRLESRAVWDRKRKVLKVAGGYSVASPLTAKFVLLGNKLYFKMQIICAPDPVICVQGFTPETSNRQVFIPQYEYAGVPGFYDKPKNGFANPDGSEPIEKRFREILSRDAPLWNTSNPLVQGTYVRFGGFGSPGLNSLIDYEVVSSSNKYIELYPTGVIGTSVEVESISSSTLTVASGQQSTALQRGRFVKVYGTSLDSDDLYELSDVTSGTFKLVQPLTKQPVTVTAVSDVYVVLASPPTIPDTVLDKMQVTGGMEPVSLLPLPKPDLKCKISIWDNGNSVIFRGDKPSVTASKIGSHAPKLVLTGIYQALFSSVNSLSRFTLVGPGKFSVFNPGKIDGFKVKPLTSQPKEEETGKDVAVLFPYNSPLPGPLQSGTTYQLTENRGATITYSLSLVGGSAIALDNTSAPISFIGEYRSYSAETLVKRDYIIQVIMPDGENLYSDYQLFERGKNRVTNTVSVRDTDPNNYVSVSWARVVGAVKYNIYRSVDDGPFKLIGSTDAGINQFLDFGGLGGEELPNLLELPPGNDTFFATALINDITKDIYQTLGRFYEVQATIQFPTAITDFQFSGDQYLQIEFFKGDDLQPTTLADLPVNSVGIDKVALGYNYGRWSPSDYDLSIKPSPRVKTSTPNSVTADGTASSAVAGTGSVGAADSTQGEEY
jgi:hypothetical protein